MSLKQHIEALLRFLEPHLGFANCHMVDFFTQGGYEAFVPPEVKNEVTGLGEESFTDFIFNNDYRSTPNLGKFVESSESYTLKNCKNVCLGVDDLFRKLESLGAIVDKFKLEIFMTAKKSHEVEILSAVAASIAQITQTSHLVDLGDGKGYLSSFLTLHNNIPVLGVDASNINTCGAGKRAQKLSRVWKTIPEAPHKSYPSKNSKKVSIELYKQVTQFIDEKFDLRKLVSENFTSETYNLGLVGLHTCGDLAPASLKIFLKNEAVTSICNVGCCYHLLTEENNEKNGFPLSSFLKKKGVRIGRSARMIANQSVERILHSRELPNITIFYRALLQVILEKHCAELPTSHVGKFKKLPQNFVEYARIALGRINVNISVPDSELQEFYNLYKQRHHELNIFYLLRSKLAPVVEALILLDRLLFLRENGVEAFLVHLFDPVVSPRCYGIIALKNNL